MFSFAAFAGTTTDSSALSTQPKIITASTSRGLRTDRTYRAYNSELNCVIADESPDRKAKFYPLEFYYAVEADTLDTDFLRPLEMNLFDAVSSHVFWCYGQHATVDFNGRKLSQQELSQRQLEIDFARKLGIISVSSGGFDYTDQDSKYGMSIVYSLIWYPKAAAKM